MTSSVYNYVNNAKLWLPMTAACHDPVNVRTLDKSGNGLNFRFGDGATASTYPTKNGDQRGYAFDGGDYLAALANQTNVITSGTWAVFFKYTVPAAGVTRVIYGHSDALSSRATLLTDGPHVTFYCGDTANNVYILNIASQQQYIFAAGYRTTDGYRRLYVNGFLAVPSNTGTTIPSTTVAGNPLLGLFYTGGSAFIGKLIWYGHWEYALSELQLRDLEQRLRRQLNDV